MSVQHCDPLRVAHRRDHSASARDDRSRVAALTDALGEERRAFEGLSYPDTSHSRTA
jgi:hypothetical protein